MKKLVSLLLALVLALGLFTSALAAGTSQVFWYTFSDVYLSSVRTSLDAALTAKGIDFVDQDANATQATQSDQITTAISSGTNLLVVNICETGADGIAQNVVDNAKNANIPLIFFNRSVSKEVVTSYDKCVFVGTNYEEAGIM
ncbi:MAG: substrate-binding domain-containing protein, partial [Eubacteriales bacterium]|nr:substrate-binding domain-containing protein [Eubacteriales bacterium]